MEAQALNINHLSLSYEQELVLSDISLSLNKGELLCIHGESGCGKSSLIKAILGFADYKGEIFICGKKLCEKTIIECRKQIAYVPQELSLPCSLVKEMIELPFSFKANKALILDDILKDWQRLGLDESLLNKRLNEISGGQRQRIMLSMAGNLSKPLLLLDESTSALDSDTALLAADYIEMLCKERNMAALVISHNIAIFKHREFQPKFIQLVKI